MQKIECEEYLKWLLRQRLSKSLKWSQECADAGNRRCLRYIVTISRLIYDIENQMEKGKTVIES